VRGLEDLGQFHANGGQFVDVKKAPVVDLLRRDTPEAQAVGLPADQLVKGVKTARIAGVAFDFTHGGGERIHQLRAFFTAAEKTALDDLLFAHALGDLFRIGLRARREMLQRGDDALKLRLKILGHAQRRQLAERRLQNLRVGARRHRQPGVEVAQEEGA
jgi:hypothetical protein